MSGIFVMITTLFEEKLSQLRRGLVPAPRFFGDVLSNRLHAQVVIKSPDESKRENLDHWQHQAFQLWQIRIKDGMAKRGEIKTELSIKINSCLVQHIFS